MNANDIGSYLIDSGHPFLSIRRNLLIVPNVSWGLFTWGEADLIIVSKSKFLSEIEIKISLKDLEADEAKKKWRYPIRDIMIKYFYYAVPIDLLEGAKKIIANSSIPQIQNAGIIAIGETGRVMLIQKPITNKKAQPLPDKDLFKLARLSVFRYWNLRKKMA
jgi:hypothetical protein